jgi:nucleoid DNA-binding protein
MKKPEIAKRLARQSGLSRAEAADELDRVVHRILSNLKRGQEVPLPGLGKLTPGPKGRVNFEREKSHPDAEG